MKNGYAALVKQRTAGDTKRRRLDDYETPADKTAYLTKIISFRGPILEPACGFGRMITALRNQTGLAVTGFDIKFGQDFLKRLRRWPGDIVTNPPYRDGLADAFAHKALELATGRVALLFESKFLFGDKRNVMLYQRFKPEAVIYIPERIYFFKGKGKPITSQFFNHCWIVWPSRRLRATNQTTRCYWPEPQP